jgi:hypothetical protein
MNFWTNINRNLQYYYFKIGIAVILAILFFTSAKYIASGLAIVPFIVLAGVFFISSIYLKPELSIVIMILIFFDLFGFIDPSIQFRIKGVFKLKDVIFILMLISIIVDIIIKKDMSFQRLQSPVNKPLIALMLLVSFGIIYSSLFRGEPLNYSLRIGRILYYYLIFFIIMYYIRSERQIRFVIFAIIAMASMVSIIYIVQFFLGSHITVTPFGKLAGQRFGDFRFARLYLSGFTVAYIGFMIAFWLFIYQRNRNRLILLLFLGVGMAFNFFRAYWIGAIFGIFLPAIFLKFDIKVKILKSCIVFLILITIFIPIIKYLSSARSTDVITLISGKFISTFSEFTDKERSYGSRLKYANSRIELLKVRKNFLLGVGFVQGDPFSSTGKRLYEISPISTGGHLGYLDIMLYMGILGLSCFAWFILAMLKRLVYIFKYTQDELYKATIMGFIGFLILCVVASLAHGPLTSIIGIVPISIFMGLSEAICMIEQKTSGDMTPKA